MIFIKKNKILFLISLLAMITFQYVQLKIIPLPSATRPISEFFIFMFFIIIIWHVEFFKASSSFKRYYLKNKNIYKWIPLVSVTIFYSLMSIIIYNNLNSSLKFIINILFAFLFYWYGYTRMGMTKNRFIKYNLFFSLPIILIGIFEIIGILGIDYFYRLVTEIRNIILTVNIDRVRLHLLFSEPSFIGTYLLFLFFLIQNSLLKRTQKLFAFSLIFIFFVLGNSLNSMIMLFSLFLGYYFFYYKKNIFFKLIVLLFFLVLLSVIVYVIVGNRLQNIFSDPSAYIRFLHLVVLSNMFIDSYGLGMGFGEFSNYFINYVSNIDLIIPTKELQDNINGKEVIPYSMFFSILGQMGILGTGAFLYLFKSIFSKYNHYKHYQLALFTATLSALPWGLPFIWALLGMIDKEVEEKCSKQL